MGLERISVKENISVIRGQTTSAYQMVLRSQLSKNMLGRAVSVPVKHQSIKCTSSVLSHLGRGENLVDLSGGVA